MIGEIILGILLVVMMVFSTLWLLYEQRQNWKDHDPPMSDDWGGKR